MALRHLKPFSSLTKNSISSFLGSKSLTLLSGVLAGAGLFNPAGAAGENQTIYYNNNTTNQFDDSQYFNLRDNPVEFTQNSNVDYRVPTYSLIGVSGTGTSLEFKSSSNSQWDFSTLTCSGFLEGSDCNYYLFSPSNSNLSLLTAYSGGQATLQSSTSDPFVINARGLKVAVMYGQASEAVTSNSRISLNNVKYINTTQNAISMGDILAGSVGSAPMVQKPENAPFNPNFIVENSSILSYRLGSFVHSDVLLKDSKLLGYIPIDAVPSFAPMPSNEQLIVGNYCNYCSGIDLFARNGRINADNILLSAGSGIYLNTGAIVGSSYIDNGRLGILTLTNSTIQTYLNNGHAYQAMTGTRSTAELITKLNVDNSNLITYGQNAYGVWSNYSSGIIKNSNIETFGLGSVAVLNEAHGFYTIENTDIITRGRGASGLYAKGSNAYGTAGAVSGPVSIVFKNGSITTEGTNLYGTFSSTVSAGITPTEVRLIGNLVANSISDYTGGMELNVRGDGSVGIGTLAGASSFASGVVSRITGYGSVFANVRDTVAGSTMNFRSTLDVENAVIHMTEDDSYVFQVQLGGIVDGRGLHVETLGDNSHFLVHQASAITYVTDSVVTLKGADSHFAFLQGKSSPASTFSLTPYASIPTRASGNITIDKNTNLYSTTVDTNDLILNNVTLNSEQGMGFILMGSESTHITINDSTLKVGTNLAANNQWLVYADNFITGGNSFATKDVQINANNSNLYGSIYADGASQLTHIDLTQSRLYGDIELTTSAKLDSLNVKNTSLWKGAIIERPIDTLNIDNTSTWEVFGGTTSYVNYINNAGTIKFNSSGGSNFQTVYVNSDYTGGGTLIMSGAYRTQDSDSNRDQLYISGDVIGSSTNVKFVSVDDIGDETVGDGIKVIEVAGSSTPTDFQQQDAFYAGLYEYTMRAGKADGTFDGAWYLSSAYNPPPVPPTEPPPAILPPPDPGPAPNPGPNPGPGPNPDPGPAPQPVPELPKNYRPGLVTASIIPSLAHAAGMAQLATYQERIAGTDDRFSGSGQWFRHFHNKNDISYQNNGTDLSKYRSFQENGANYDNVLHGFQFGMDLYRSDSVEPNQENPAFSPTLNPMQKGGVYAGIARSSANVDAIYTDTRVGKVGLTNITLGGYYTEHFENGVYSDTNISLSHLHNISSDSIEDNLGKASTSGQSFILSTEVGYRHALSESTFIEPQAQVSYQYMHLRDLKISNDLSANFDDTKAITARAGVRVGTTFGEENEQTAYIRAAYEQSFASKADIRYQGTGTQHTLIQNEMHGSWIKVDAGVSGKISENTVGYAAIDYSKGVNDSTGSKIGIKVGLQYHF